MKLEHLSRLALTLLSAGSVVAFAGSALPARSGPIAFPVASRAATISHPLPEMFERQPGPASESDHLPNQVLVKVRRGSEAQVRLFGALAADGDCLEALGPDL